MRRTLGLAAGMAFLAAGGAQGAEDVMVVFDGSNSMWGQIDGVAKIEIARDAMGSLMGDWAEGTSVGLMAYGHRREGDCRDVETMIAPGPIDRNDFMSRIRGITPRGKTPLTTAVESAAEALAYRDNPATVVLITDGIETCRRDPCALADELERSGVGFTAHVVGFDLQGEDHQAVACIAERTGGRFIAAGDAGELGQALSEVSATVAEAPQPEPAPEPEPEPAVELTAPDSAVTGSSFSVSWVAAEQQRRDFVTIVAMGADEGKHGDYVRVKDDSEGRLRAPAEPGFYEVRYVLDEGRATVASTDIEIIEADVSVTAPDSATAGASFEVTWSNVIHPRDFVTIVAMGADEGEHGDYVRVKDDSDGRLRAPAEPGFYEVRYVLDEGRRTLASADIEIVGADVSLTAPDTAITGSNFEVSWSNTVHPRDFVTIVPMGAEEGSHGDHDRAGKGTTGELTAPSETGLYEVRYILEEGRRTLASAPIEVVAADIELSGPDTVRADSEIRVSWSGTVPSKRDFVTIVPMGAEEGTHGDHARVGGKTEADLDAPGDTGLYEIRYVLDEGRRTLARHTVEVVAATAPLSDGGSLTVPESGAPGETIEVSWSAEAGDNDQRVALAGSDQADFTWIEVQKAGDGPLSFTLPDKAGYYEFRLLDITDRKVLSRAIIDVR